MYGHAEIECGDGIERAGRRAGTRRLVVQQSATVVPASWQSRLVRRRFGRGQIDDDHAVEVRVAFGTLADRLAAGGRSPRAIRVDWRMICRPARRSLRRIRSSCRGGCGRRSQPNRSAARQSSCASNTRLSRWSRSTDSSSVHVADFVAADDKRVPSRPNRAWRIAAVR